MALPDLARRIRHAGETEVIYQHGTHGASAIIRMPTDPEMLLALAEAAVPCPTSHHWGPKGRPLLCNMCGGTGVASLYPTLREPCNWRRHWFDDEQTQWNSLYKGICDGCKGRGWVPVQQDVVGKLWDIPYGVRKEGDVVYVRLHENTLAYTGRGETLESRLLSAIILAVAGEEGKP